jgi:hypothetical protein
MNQVTMTQEQMALEIAKLRAENTRLMTNKSTSDGIKLSSKGGISVYGLGRFPVTLYLSQWETLLGKAEEIKAFAIANADKLASKPTK